MSEDYKRFLEKSITVQEGMLQNLRALTDNTKDMNDRFVTHDARAVEIEKEVKATKNIIHGYLKWAVISLVIILGGERAVKLILEKI